MSGVRTQYIAKMRGEGQTLVRVAADVRTMLAEAPREDPDVRSLLQDCDVLDRVGNWLLSSTPVTFGEGIDVAGDVE